MAAYASSHELATENKEHTLVRQHSLPAVPAQRDALVDSGAQSLPSSSGSSQQRDETAEISLKEMNRGLLSILECPVCMEFMVPPIYLCSKGHNVCMTCRPKLTQCPSCRAIFGGRNLGMEKVTEIVMYPCKNESTGCNVTVRLTEKKSHEESCGFRHYPCIFSDCQWKGYTPELVTHTMASHSDKLIVGNNQAVQVALRPIGGHFNWVLSALNEVFQVSFLVDNSEKLLGAVYYVGPAEKASKYYYTFRVKNHTDPNKSIIYTDTAQVDAMRTASLATSNDCFNINLDVAKKYCAPRTSNLLPVSVTIDETYELE